ncbi:MAG: hypothetical protein BWY29_00497 [Microgenomates group bacterium ADurb.Bin238]|nr:MAG: hypothetical protein BWY29_00497 [Microgenomates group bacterium ADurb.Bin238]
MVQRLNEPVSVTLFFNHQNHSIFPKTIIWHNHSYPITKLGLHHSYRLGSTLYHIFSVVSRSYFFRLKLDTSTLHWTLEELSDGLPT